MTQLSVIDEELALALASGMTHEAAGKPLGMSRSTVWRRTTVPEFAARVRELRRSLSEEATSRLANRAADAIETLHLIATGDEQDNPDRIRASDLLLSYFLKFSERADIEERVRKLEELNSEQLSIAAQETRTGESGETSGATEGEG